MSPTKLGAIRKASVDIVDEMFTPIGVVTMDRMESCSYVCIKVQWKLNYVVKTFSIDFSKSTKNKTIITSISYMNPRSGIGLAAMLIN